MNFKHIERGINPDLDAFLRSCVKISCQGCKVAHFYAKGPAEFIAKTRKKGYICPDCKKEQCE